MVPAAARQTLAFVADLITRARSGVYRDSYTRELEYAPEAEAPTRFAKALMSLACGIAMAYDQTVVGGEALRLVLRVALDCLPAIRRRVMTALVREAITPDSGGTLSTLEVAGSVQFSTTAIRRALEDLQALDVVTCHKALNLPQRWELQPEAQFAFVNLTAAVGCHDGPPDISEKAESVPEESEGASGSRSDEEEEEDEEVAV